MAAGAGDKGSGGERTWVEDLVGGNSQDNSNVQGNNQGNNLVEIQANNENDNKRQRNAENEDIIDDEADDLGYELDVIQGPPVMNNDEAAAWPQDDSVEMIDLEIVDDDELQIQQDIDVLQVQQDIDDLVDDFGGNANVILDAVVPEIDLDTISFRNY
jgi:hypothetical protein